LYYTIDGPGLQAATELPAPGETIIVDNRSGYDKIFIGNRQKRWQEEHIMSFSIITVNREFESAGNEIAQQVAARLGIAYYDKFLITAAAEHSGVAEQRVEASDERLESRFEYSQAEAAFYFTSAKAPMPTGAQVAEVQFRLIREIAEQGPCVIVGRCANHVLRERDDVLDLFIHAGEEYRLQRAITKLGLTEKKARKVLKSTDKARRAYYKNYTGRDWNDPDLYDLVLNSDHLGAATCVDIICNLYNVGRSAPEKD